MTTIREALAAAQSQLTQSSTPRLDARLLLRHILSVDDTYLIAHDDRALSDGQIAAYHELIARRADGEPVAYLIGQRGFYGLDFAVTLAVLVPRPETEHLIEAALDWGRERGQLVAADIGTGSGAIAVTVAKHLPQAMMHAVDISPDALAVARHNAARHAVNVNFHEGSLAAPLIESGVQVDLLLANLPYIATDDLAQLAVSRHEPALALDGGADGLDAIRALLAQVPQVCTPDALILLEIGADQGAQVRDLAQAMLQPQRVTVLQDYAGLDRVVAMQL